MTMRSKEEIYEQYIGNGQYGIDFEKKHILEAMDEYASEVLREELNKIPELKTAAYEWHNYETGHCYVDYIPHVNQDEKNGYIKKPLFNRQILSEVLKEELVIYTIWHQDKMFGCHALKEAIEYGVDEYLKTK